MTSPPYQFGYTQITGSASGSSWTSYINGVLGAGGSGSGHAGDMGLIVILSAASPGTTTITDGASNTWTQVASFNVAGSWTTMFATQYPGKALSSTPGFTFTTSVSQNYRFSGYGLPGVATIDSVTTALATSNTPSVTVSAVPARD